MVSWIPAFAGMTIRGVLQVSPCEVIIVDNASTDSSADGLEECTLMLKLSGWIKISALRLPTITPRVWYRMIAIGWHY
jgi:hypothetical protein